MLRRVKTTGALHAFFTCCDCDICWWRPVIHHVTDAVWRRPITSLLIITELYRNIANTTGITGVIECKIVEQKPKMLFFEIELGYHHSRCQG